MSDQATKLKKATKSKIEFKTFLLSCIIYPMVRENFLALKKIWKNSGKSP